MDTSQIIQCTIKGLLNVLLSDLSTKRHKNERRYFFHLRFARVTGMVKDYINSTQFKSRAKVFIYSIPRAVTLALVFFIFITHHNPILPFIKPLCPTIRILSQMTIICQKLLQLWGKFLHVFGIQWKKDLDLFVRWILKIKFKLMHDTFLSI